jgi:hypothetical protein
MKHGDIVRNRNTGQIGKLIIEPGNIEIHSLETDDTRWVYRSMSVEDFVRAGWWPSGKPKYSQSNIR